MRIPFSLQLQTLRNNARLTNRELARLADVPESTISGLQNGNRRIGEVQARKLAMAFHFTGNDLEQFVLDAIDTCSEKVLNESKPYPARLLNLLAVQLHRAGIEAASIRHFTVSGSEKEHDVAIVLNNGTKATLKTQLVCC